MHLHCAYGKYKLATSSVSGGLALDVWCELSSQQSVQFQYWFSTL